MAKASKHRTLGDTVTAFLSYWIPATAERELSRGGLIRHSAGAQLKRVAPGDSVYLVTVWSTGKLTLLGRIIVAVRTDQAGAEHLLGTSDLWAAPWHVVAEPGTEVPIRDLDISDIAGDLEFDSPRPRLTIVHNRANGQQLQSLRRLTPGSAKKLEDRLQAARRLV